MCRHWFIFVIPSFLLLVIAVQIGARQIVDQEIVEDQQIFEKLPEPSRSKFTVQSEINALDDAKAKREDWFRAYFPELLAVTLTFAIVLGLIYCYCFRWQEEEVTFLGVPLFVEESRRAGRAGRYARSMYVLRGGPLGVPDPAPNVQVVLPKVRGSGLGRSKCSRPSCVCGPEGSSSNYSSKPAKGWTAWRNRADNEAYGAAGES